MELKQALKALNINKFLEEKKEEATKFFISGLIENGNRLNDAVKTVRKFLDEID